MIDNTDKNFEPDDTAASSYDGGARTETTDDVLVDGLFGKQNGAGKENAGGAQNAQNGNARFPRDAARRADAQSGAQKQSFSEQDVMALCTRISSLMDKSRFEDALSIVFSLRGDARRAVRDNLSVTIPMGSRDGDLRGIAAGALVQSYLELGKIVRRDIEEKLFAIIESSEPEYDEDDEIIEQTPDDILYKVTACVIFMCVMTPSQVHDHRDQAQDSKDSRRYAERCLFSEIFHNRVLRIPAAYRYISAELFTDGSSMKSDRLAEHGYAALVLFHYRGLAFCANPVVNFDIDRTARTVRQVRPPDGFCSVLSRWMSAVRNFIARSVLSLESPHGSFSYL